VLDTKRAAEHTAIGRGGLAAVCLLATLENLSTNLKKAITFGKELPPLWKLAIQNPGTIRVASAFPRQEAQSDRHQQHQERIRKEVHRVNSPCEISAAGENFL